LQDLPDDADFALMVMTYSTTRSRYGAFTGRDQYTVIHVAPERTLMFQTTAV